MAFTEENTPGLTRAREVYRRNLIKDTMESGRLASMFGLGVAMDVELPMIIKKAGFQSVYINMEHWKVSLDTASTIAAVSLAIGLTPIFVVPSLTSEWISRACDIGAQGIIVPRSETEEQAKEFVKYCKHRPIGERPQTSFVPMMQYDDTLSIKARMVAANETTLCIPMIETVLGVENCEAIAAVPGVDAIFVGCFDLSDDMGIAGQYADPRIWNAVEKISKAADAASVDGRKVWVGLGGLETKPDLFKKLAQTFSNIRLCMAGRDLKVLKDGIFNVYSRQAELDAALA